MTKSALYKHYAGKQAIFDAIVARMAGQDAERAQENGVPAEEYAEGDESYGRTTARDTAGYARAQFVYWTQDAFAADFRRMLTLEQYRSGEMSALYHAYLGAGPLEYMRDLFREGGACVLCADASAVRRGRRKGRGSGACAARRTPEAVC